MNIVKINNKFSVSDQLITTDIDSLSAKGIKLIICNRPDGEAPNQPSFKEIKHAANKQGIKFVNIPCKGTNIPEDLLEEFMKVIDNSTDKIHAYCRTGNRSSVFWGLAKARSSSVEDILSEAKSLGLNLDPVVEQIWNIRKKNIKTLTSTF